MNGKNYKIPYFALRSKVSWYLSKYPYYWVYQKIQTLLSLHNFSEISMNKTNIHLFISAPRSTIIIECMHTDRYRHKYTGNFTMDAKKTRNYKRNFLSNFSYFGLGLSVICNSNIFYNVELFTPLQRLVNINIFPCLILSLVLSR